MPPTSRFLNKPAGIAAMVARISTGSFVAGTSYATVRDYCESADLLPDISPTDGDLKNVQRPWAVKTVLACVPPPARLLEIGGGEPIVSGLLAELGYDVTLVDPYDGFGNGPTDYQRYVKHFPQVKILPEYFRPGLSALASKSFDAIFSVSVLEHIPAESIPPCFQAMEEFLRPGGASIHCFDFILQGRGEADDPPMAKGILAEQSRLAGAPAPEPLEALLERLKADVETFYLSPQGHHNWRGGRPYEEFPFRKVVSLQTIAFLPRS
jgi:SAM-dependent methyltransferase